MGFIFSVNKVVSLLVFSFVLLSCFTTLGSEAQRLPDEEVQALQAIFRKMRHNVTASPTSCNDQQWNFNITEDLISLVKCDCSNGTFCHVTNMLFKGLNLIGPLPEEFLEVTHLQELDLTRNFINGSIPQNFSRLPLRIMSFLGNRLSGSIPSEIGNIATLEQLNLEDNQLSGALPPSLGNLNRLNRLLLSANNFTGSIPESFGKLKNLVDFRIEGNTFSGKIPDFIGNWTNLTRLDMQGTSMEGPIPLSISLVKNLTELRISDLTNRLLLFLICGT